MVEVSLTGHDHRRSVSASLNFLCLLMGICAFLMMFPGCGDKPEFDTLSVAGNEKVISYYRFGIITVGGKTYRSDIIIFPDRVKYNWHALSDHFIKPETISDVTNADIKVLIIGTGAQGGVAVSKETLDHLKSIGIETHVMDTWKAVELYNNSKKEKLAAVLHINC